MNPQSPDVGAYARSLLALAEATCAVDRLERESGEVRELLDGNPDLRRFLRDPAVKPEGKVMALDELLKDRVHAALRHFLLTLAAQQELDAFGAIAEEFRIRIAAQRKETSGEVLSARPLSDETVARIAEAVGRRLGKRVRLIGRVSDHILAGVIVRVGDVVVDGTVDRRLAQIGSALLG